MQNERYKCQLLSFI